MAEGMTQDNMKRLEDLDWRWPAMAVSLLWSLIVISGNPLPNDDAFSYLHAAEVFSQNGLDATLSEYGWYGYSVLIALVDSLLPTDLLMSAHLLNAAFYCLLVFAFITLSGELGSSRNTSLFAALIILCYPTVNEMRFNLVRDFAYWGFVLSALIQLIRFRKSGAIIHGLGWMTAMMAAVFFRLEGLLILILSPFALLFGQDRPGSSPVGQLGLLFGFLLVGAIVILGVFQLAGIDLVEVFNFAYRWYLPLLNEYPDTLQNAAEGVSLSDHVSEQLLPFSGKGFLLLFIGNLYAVIANLVMALGPAVSLLMLYGFIKHRPALDTASLWPWRFYLAGALLALLLFVSIMQFLTSRYAVMTALLLLATLPHLLDTLYRAATAKGKAGTFRVTALICAVYFSIDSLVTFGYSKSYIEEAIAWTRNELPPTSSLVTNNFAVAYFSGKVEQYDDIDPDPALVISGVSGSDYLVLDLPHDASETRALIESHRSLEEVTRFSNSRNDAVIVFRVGASD